jgi:hypothetical protein
MEVTQGRVQLDVTSWTIVWNVKRKFLQALSFLKCFCTYS